MFLLNFPMMLIPLIIYNILGLTRDQAPWDGPILDANMMSGALFTLTLGQALILGALILLFIEIVKAARLTSATIVDHLLSTLVLIAFIVEFLLVMSAATATFFTLLAIAFVDVVAGYSVSIRNASRDFTIER